MHRLAAGHNTICGSFKPQPFCLSVWLLESFQPLPAASPRLYTSVSLGAPSRLAPAQLVVGSSGLEPPTSRLSGARSNHLSYEPIVKAAVFRPARPPCGGDEEVRTPDPLRARQVLSQLSYTPIKISFDSHQMKFAKQGFAWFALGFRNAALPFSF